jgi:hypothetical protein
MGEEGRTLLTQAIRELKKSGRDDERRHKRNDEIRRSEEHGGQQTSGAPIIWSGPIKRSGSRRWWSLITTHLCKTKSGAKGGANQHGDAATG